MGVRGYLPPHNFIVIHSRAQLIRRNEEHKHQGIKFSKTPSWQQLSVAFGYLEACQQMVQSYLQTHPNEQLKGISIELKLG